MQHTEYIQHLKRKHFSLQKYQTVENLSSSSKRLLFYEAFLFVSATNSSYLLTRCKKNDKIKLSLSTPWRHVGG